MGSMRRFLLAIGISLAAFAPKPADATIVTVTYEGTMLGGFDGVGYFGLDQLAGQHYKAVYVFDTTLGHEFFNSPTANYALGGSFFGSSSPALSATMIINNVAFSFQPNDTGFIAAASDPPPFPNSVAQHDAREFQQVNNIVQSARLIHSVGSRDQDLPAALAGPVSNYIIDSQDTVSALFSASYFNSNTQRFIIFVQDARLSPETLSISAAVPEPSTWAMMILGFAGVGFLSYRRRNNRAALSAA